MKYAWTKRQVCDYFDNNWNVSLVELSFMSGHSVDQLKKLLMS